MVAEAQPLANRAVVVTRPQHQAAEMADSLRALGAEPVAVPAIEIQPKGDLSRLDEALHHLERYSWLLFTSVNGVRITLERYDQLGLDRGSLAETRLAAIGPATAGALRHRGLEVSFVPASYVAEEVVAGLPLAPSDRVLLPRAEGARPVLPEGLEARGASVDEIPIYQSVAADLSPHAIERLRAGVDAVTFTSPSTAEFFTETADRAGLHPLDLPGAPLIACIGPITADAVESLGYHVGLVARRFTAQGLVEALASHFGKETAGGHR